MRIYIASSFRNLAAVQLLTAALTERGHIIEDWTKLAPPPAANIPLHEAKAIIDSDASGRVFDFCASACTCVDLLVYVGPAGQDAACEVGLAAASGVTVYGLSGPLERPGLILSRLVSKWFTSAGELLDAVNGDCARQCRVCGRTQFNACAGEYWWVSEDLCSACAAKAVINF